MKNFINCWLIFFNEKLYTLFFFLFQIPTDREDLHPTIGWLIENLGYKTLGGLYGGEECFGPESDGKLYLQSEISGWLLFWMKKEETLARLTLLRRLNDQSFHRSKERQERGFLLVYRWRRGSNVVPVSTCSQDMNTRVDPSYGKHASMHGFSCPSFLRRGGANSKLLGACLPEEKITKVHA